mmetsp:Transcript_47049/g.118516  ORF Transcript_47049/g.118516 Transcript_47049/m.118516 type:complete len:810 (-) Transcript_47049:68-2497(-)
MTAPAPTPLSVLALHGARQSADLFSARVDRLARALSDIMQLEFVDGPVCVPQSTTLCWWPDQDVISPEGQAGQQAGQQAAIDLITRHWRTAGPFHALLAFSQGAALALAALPHLTPPPQFAVLVAPPLPVAPRTPLPCPCMWVWGKRDSVCPLPTPPPAHGRLHVHAGAHEVPQDAGSLAVLREFVTDVLACEPRSDDLAEELAALEMIYDPTSVHVTTPPVGLWPTWVTVDVERMGENEGSVHVRLRLEVHRGYPAVPAAVRWLNAHKDLGQPFNAAMLQAAGGLVETPHLFTLAEAAIEWVVGATATGAAVPAAPPCAQTETQPSQMSWYTNEDVDEAALQRGCAEAHDILRDWTGMVAHAGSSDQSTWTLVVGLVGKPSAGKSSFYNACLQDRAANLRARVAAFPFTTIEPNTGTAVVATHFPASVLGQTCGHTAGICTPALLSRHGECCPVLVGLPEEASPVASSVQPGAPCHSFPVVLKDVAGMVPGAYKGLGRGNAFLNDLVDADVLIHVVDASGSTDDEGNPAADAGADAVLNEIRWVRQEIHQWVFCNVRRRWATCVRRPDRLPQLFSGYHASRPTVECVLRLAGLSSLRALEEIRIWGEADLHRLVAVFTHVRFPIILALNKADIPGAEERISHVLANLSPLQHAVPVSALTETWLRDAAAAGTVDYRLGAGGFQVLAGHYDPPPDMPAAATALMSRYGGTGVLAALTHAIALKQPVVVWAAGDTAHQAVVLKRGCSVGDAFVALKKRGWLEGEFVRAERLREGGARRPLRKDEVLASGWVVHLMSTRRSAWQKKTAGVE